jgi:signal transduction histidine kinase
MRCGFEEVTRPVLYRSVLLMTVAGASVTGAILALMVVMSWRSVQRLEPMDLHLGFYRELEAVHRSLADEFVPGVRLRARSLELLRESAAVMRRIASAGAGLDEATPGALGRSADLLEPLTARASEADPGETGRRIADAMRLLSQALRAEIAAQQALFRALREDNEHELQAAIALAALLPAAGAGFLVFFRRRVLAPLNDLSYLMGLLARQDYTYAAIERTDPLLRPLFEKYNRMVRRVSDAEQDHIRREDSLQRDVDTATRALLQQQLALTRAERLATLGDVSAHLAHELRNPLSGVLMALTNLRNEIESADQDERLGLAIAELERIGRLLSRLVEQARQTPERPRVLVLAGLVEELRLLMRYQLPATVLLDVDVPPLRCRLPESGLRHALLNLIVNAAQALGERGGHIGVGARREAGELVIWVCDSGPGFPVALLESGVHEYGTWRAGGAGLGLASVRRFASQQGGRLELANRPEGGACATLHLPQEDTHG